MTQVCKMLQCCNSEQIVLTDNQRPILRCCEVDHFIDSTAAINAELVTYVTLCRKSWCVKAINYGNDGSEAPPFCAVSPILGEFRGDYISKAGRGGPGNDEGEIYPDFFNDAEGVADYIPGQTVFFQWQSANGGSFTVEVGIFILNDHQFIFNITGEESDVFSGALIIAFFGSADQGLPIAIQAYKRIDFPFDLGELLGPHCGMQVDNTAGNAMCIRNARVHIW